MSKVNVFAMYLPQYHETEINSLFWGKGFTDWVSVKNARPLFEGHLQPKVPLNDNYYDLSNKDHILWQANLAKKYGISGWGIYHYWFSSEKKALTTPAKIILNNTDIQIPFFFAWDNASWKRTWSNVKGNDWAPLMDNNSVDGKPILVEYILGDQSEWKKHFDYLLPFFRDSRYVKEKNKPLFLIYNYETRIGEMVKYWDFLARKNGFDGIKVIFSYNPFHGIPKSDYKFRYEPLYSGWGSFFERSKRKIVKREQQKVKIYDYDKVWRRILHNARICVDKKTYYGAFVNYDDTPRRGEKGKVIINSSPEKFEKYIKQLIYICEKQKKDYIFLTAWNEWGEGAYLEPDSVNGCSFLEKIC